jgi:EAL domain-containing protein (putative c-di-GMP-specific phosphodiesterase class I)
MIDSMIIRIPRLDQIVVSKQLRPAFQPIVSLEHELPILYGFESLARYREDTPLKNPQLLFRYAEKKGQIASLEVACLRKTLAEAAQLAKRRAIFANLHPAVLSQGGELLKVVEQAIASGFDASRLVLEITEQAAIVDVPSAMSTIEHLRGLQIRFALDDLGVAYSHLPLIHRIRPSFLKISHEFGSNFEQDPTKEKIIRNIVALAKDFDCSTILEGIETAETAHAARLVGVTHGQGYFFGRPADVQTLVN